ncbi:ThiF family adenylyltransferase [Microbulbifer sp. VAAF005]|uniref:ThiF family adenylyltransferase n=1 Tax=Microbulbifer sp. VAAF005 TaxID=3034230 RepID=UPI0024AD81F8|nr:ThiF family adenylyltransferase [Microbulbifer sp. VAAF005]WHI44620.1 ThiF family adenylyltransferase [Microbulbifer sp. VAAF005]
MRGNTAIADVVESLRERGFQFVGKSTNGWFKLNGHLCPPGADRVYPCEVQFDPTFLNMPRIRLLETPSGLPAVVPHLGAGGDLCYLAEGSVTLDIYDPVGQTLACLDRASSVLGRIIGGEMVEDLAEEFFAYWRGECCFVDIEGNSLGRQQCIVAEAGGRFLWFITDNEDRTVEKIRSLSAKIAPITILTYRIKTSAQPRPLISNWPPVTVGDILSWQSTLDRRCRRKIHARIKEGIKNKANGALIIIESPLMTYGLAIWFDRKLLSQKEKRADRRDLSFGLKVIPLSVVRIDSKYLAQRNIPGSKTLAGINLAIAGCGTIGGYLSEMLVKAGAGTCGGTLTLVDFDHLFPQNLGRHRLGFSDLLKNKAEAMANELRRLAPGTDIRALPVDVRQAELGRLDLLIDATGEESLGHWLCRSYSPPLPMLSIWIEGPGTAIRGFLRSTTSGACYRCLWHSNRRGELHTTVEPLPTTLAGHGCEGLYVPFPASVSVQAASLGAEMALDWINGALSPALRTRLVDPSAQLATPDCDPIKDPDCPICNS